jgi:hypothetical protein
LSTEVASADSGGIKYKKYYDLVDAQDAHYTALVPDSRFKILLLEKKLGAVTARKVIRTVKESLHGQ